MGDITENVDFLKGASPSPNSKRKRDFGDSPEEQRKRSVTATTASTTTPLIGADAPNLSFIESAVEAAAAANGTGITNAATVAALTALQQATRDANESHEQTSLAMNVEHSHSHSPLTHAPSPLTHSHSPLSHNPHTPHTPHQQQHTHTHQHQHPEPSNDPADPANASSTAAAALGTMYPTMHVPTSTEQQFVQGPTSSSDMNVSGPQGPLVGPGAQPGHESAYPDVGVGHADHGLGLVARGHPDMAMQHRKPAVGTAEWHKQRKDNHKEVERRRRETINEGINELAKIVPQCEKNKGSILQKAVQFIQQLKANEASNIEKWTLEKLLTEQAIGELSQSNEKLKAECERLYRELETYKRMCQSAGLEIPSKQQDTGVPTTTA
ncbi:Transcriptional regulator CBF1 [Ceratocystis lukuohia]|uniref:Transcriptional regulator CBF1 n=2 Tax=Ceratocystis TaxID=5157 RepID=A0A2C5WYW7_9PEZI|nr:Transcriptional regulator CBF1 [Ceratocystis fimbriata CBS 114723]